MNNDESIYCVYTEERGFNVYPTKADLDASGDTNEKVTAVISKEDYDKAEGVVRYINGKVVLGKSEEELKKEEDSKKVAECRQYLFDTDYVAYKLAEVSDDATAYAKLKETYADTLAKRDECRKFIDNLS